MEKARQAHKWARDQAERALKIDFIRFGVVGSMGFLITATGLRLFHGVFDMHITPATLLSSELGLLSNFMFHEKWTYKHVDHHHKSLALKFAHFHMSSWSGVALITVLESVGVRVFHLDYMVSLVFAAAITMFWNFFWTKYYIFRGRTPSVLMHPEDVAIKEE